MRNIHPGEILLEEFFNPSGLSLKEFSDQIGLSERVLREIMIEQRSLSFDYIKKFSKAFGTTEQFWINLQHNYDTRKAHFELKEKYNYYLLSRINILSFPTSALQMMLAAANSHYGSRYYYSALVRASSRDEARKLMSKACGYEGKEVWLNKKHSKCSMISQCLSGGTPIVLIKSTENIAQDTGGEDDV